MPLDQHRLTAIADAYPTIAGKVRALASEGATRREIADHLGRSYQQVRQVLVETERRRGGRTRTTIDADAGESGRSRPAGTGRLRLGIDPEGRVRLPDEVMDQLGVRPGAALFGRVVAGELVLTSAAAGMCRAQEIVRGRISSSVRLADELLGDRRRDAGE